MSAAETIEALRAAGCDEFEVKPDGTVIGRVAKPGPPREPAPLLPPSWPYVSPDPTWIPGEIVPYVADDNELCAHRDCSGCKSGTCSGIHWLVCTCRRCQPYFLSASTFAVHA